MKAIETPNPETTRPTEHRLVYGDVVPIFRWAGSKRKSLEHLEPLWSETFSRYIEPFVGSACLFLKVKPKAAILGDLNSSLIEAYRVIRDSPHHVAEALYALARDKTTYYDIRLKIRTETDHVARAIYFVYLNRNCFNGIYRTSLKGDFNVPYGTKQGQYPRVRDFVEIAKLLKQTTLVAGDFGATLRHVRKNDFVYLDPPFAATGVRTFVEYGKKSFEGDDVIRLDRHLHRIHEAGAFFLVSYADCPAARSIARGWNSKTIQVRRHIAGFTAKRKMAGELLISNLRLPRNA